jgi:hypothetical protein
VSSSRQLDTRESLACIEQTVLQRSVERLWVRLARTHVIEVLLERLRRSGGSAAADTSPPPHCHEKTATESGKRHRQMRKFHLHLCNHPLRFRAIRQEENYCGSQMN